MTTPSEIRAQAARIVAEVNAKGKSLDTLLMNAGGSPQERGLLRSLVYGTIRWQLRLEPALDRLSTRPQNELHSEVRALLLIGLFQILQTDIAVHAAVAETVEATRALKQPKASGFVNAVLRRCLREKSVIAEQLDADLAHRTAHPAWLIESLRRDWPDHYAEILDANNQHPPMWLRVNRRRAKVEEYQSRLRAAGFESERSEVAPEALLLQTPTDVRGLPGFDDGDVSVQDAAAQLAAHILGAEPNDRVLDACAAPGGKTSHILELEPRIASMLAIDNQADRLHKVRENLNRLGLATEGAAVEVREADAAEPGQWWDGQPYQRILLDVPCSATGVIRRHPDIKLLRRPADIQELARRQAQMLRRVWPLLAPGGRLLYASCSALKAETSVIVAAFLSDQSDAVDMTLEAASKLRALVKSSWPIPQRSPPGLAIRAGEAQMDGFYYACLRKG